MKQYIDFQWMEEISYLKKIKNRINFRYRIGDILCWLPKLGLVPKPRRRKPGISAYICIKNEAQWIEPTLRSISPFVDQFSIVDNGSTDDTFSIVKRVAAELRLDYVIESVPDADFGEVRDIGLKNTTRSWVLRWDGDMIARTTGGETLRRLRDYIFSLDQDRYYTIYFPHIQLEGDLFHQNPDELIHSEEYLFTYSPKLHHKKKGRLREVMYPLYYKRMYWWNPSSFHIASLYDPVTLIKRKYWEAWRNLADYDSPCSRIVAAGSLPTLESYTKTRIREEYGTESLEEAGVLHLRERFSNLVPYDHEKFGDYPALLKPYLDTLQRRIVYRNGHIAGRTDIMPILDRLDERMKQLTVDVLIMTRNREEFAVATVKKLLEQDYLTFRIIVCDQSDIPSLQLKTMAAANGRLLYHVAQTRGLTVGRNEALSLSSADIVIFADDDVIPADGFIEGHVLAYVNDSIGAAAGKIIDRRPSMMKPLPYKKVGKINFWTGFVRRGFFVDRFLDVETFPGGNMSFRRSVLERSGGFDSRFGGSALLEETDASLRVRKLGYSIRYTPHAMLTHLAASTGGCRQPDICFDVYWYAHNWTLLYLKYFPRYTLPVWLGVRIAKFIRDSLNTFRLAPLIKGIQGMYDGFRAYRGTDGDLQK